MKYALVLLFLLVGCSTDPHVGQYQAAQVLADAQVTAGGQVDAARAAALDRVEAAHPVPADCTEAVATAEPAGACATARATRNAALEAEEAHWRPAGETLDAIAAGVRTWLSGIAFNRSDVTELGTQAVALYNHLADLVNELGVHLPRL